MTRKEQIIKVLNDCNYGGVDYVADKILALDKECLGVDEIAKIARICLIEKGFRDNLNSTSKAIAHALAGKIAKPQEPKCTCSIGAISKSMITDKDCPLHGRKVGKIEPTNPFRSKPPERFAEVHYAFCSMADKLDELVEVINKLNGVE